MKRSLIFLIIVALLGGGAFLAGRKLSKSGKVAPSTVSGKIPKGLISAYCYYVADGDTIYVKLKNGKKEKVRLVGINTPEIAHEEGEKSEPGGEGAKKYVINRVLKKTVLLDIDDLSPTDYYGRTLALVYLHSTKKKIPRNSLNAELLHRGYAKLLYISPSEFNPRRW